ncbi:MAG: ABC transporter permease [Verrucomicrobiae bacterium]|jgi:spermidine/putrescine transport system permease protein|nr:ABC transporter permease [Verrucomicrobiae bacterium]
MKKYLAITGPIAAGIYCFLYLPILVIVLNSFNSARGEYEWKGFDLRWYRTLFADEAALSALQNSLVLATTSAAIATVIGTLLGYGLNRYRFPGKRTFNGFLHLPAYVPDIVLASALLLFFTLLRQRAGWLAPGMTTMILAHVTMQIPIVAIIVRARLEIWGDSYEEAAADLGASPTKRFRMITVPLMKPGVIAGGLLAFTLSLGDFVVSLFTAGPGSKTVPILVYQKIGSGHTNDLNALSTLIIAISALTAIIVALIQSSRRYQDT